MQDNTDTRSNLIQSAGRAVGFTTGFSVTLGTTGVATASVATAAPVILGAMLGTMILALPTWSTQRNIETTFKLDTKPMANRCCHFLLTAASTTLSVLVGLAILSAFMSIIANPFTLPALVAGGISASIMLGIYLMTKIVQPRQHSLSLYRARMLHAARNDVFDQNTNGALQVLLDPNIPSGLPSGTVLDL